MMIDGLSAFASTARVFNPVLTPAGSPAAQSGPAQAKGAAQIKDAAPDGQVQASTQASAQASASAFTPAKTGASSSDGDLRANASAPASAAAKAIALEELITGYTTTVAGTKYRASVDESDSDYTASVASLTGATATGTTEQNAENSLGLRIDTLV